MDMSSRIFVSHCGRDASLAVAIASALRKCVPGGIYCYENTTKSSYPDEMATELARCTHILVLVGDDTSVHQSNEVAAFYDKQSGRKYWFVVDCRSTTTAKLPERFSLLAGITKYTCDPSYPARDGLMAACEVARAFRFPWQASDGLPANPHLFDYEKRIIDFYTNLLAGRPEEDSHEKLLGGAPAQWPCIETLQHHCPEPRMNADSLQDDVGEWRDPEAMVLAAALSLYHDGCGEAPEHRRCQMKNGLCFPEAGPRRVHFFPQAGNGLNVGILVAGGIAPGINAVIDGITRRHYLYAKRNKYTVNVHGLLDGFQAFGQHTDASLILLPDEATGKSGEVVTAELASAGGSMLGTSRVDSLIDPQTRIKELENIVHQAYRWPLDILYVIGGDGSMKAAHAIYSHSRDYAARTGILDKPLSVVGVPKTMDNDILWVWQSFGFLSAVEKAREVIHDLHTEVTSNPRLCVVQLFGSDSGFVVSHAVLASQSGACDAALIPEVPFTMRRLAEFIMRRMASRRSRKSGGIPAALVVMAETAVPDDASDFIEDEDVGLLPKEKQAIRDFEALRAGKRRIQGQTDEWLRSAGLKIVSRGLEKLIKGGSIRITGDFVMPNWGMLRVFTNEPRHLLRAISPSCLDIITGQRLGTLAVDNALAGYTDFMVSQWLTEYVLVPLSLVVLGRKRIPRKGVFWRSVESKTGQEDLSDESNVRAGQGTTTLPTVQ